MEVTQSYVGGDKKDIPGRFNLHELASEEADAVLCECMDGEQQEPFAEEALPPETDVQGQDVIDLAGGELRVCIHGLHAVLPIFIGRSYGGMVGKGDLGIGDDAGGEEGMGGIAEAALHPAYGKGDLSQSCLHGTGIAAMAHKASAVPTGALQLVYLDGIHGIIIRFL